MVVIVVTLAAVVGSLALSYDEQLQDPAVEDRDQDGNPWAEDQLLAPEDSTAGAESVRYRILFEVGSNLGEDSEELSNVDVIIDSTDTDMFSTVGPEDFERLEVNGGERNIDGDDLEWDSDSNGAELNIGVDNDGATDFDFDEGDEIILIFDDVDNPEDPGEYDVTVELNGDGQRNGVLEIIDSSQSLLARTRSQAETV